MKKRITVRLLLALIAPAAAAAVGEPAGERRDPALWERERDEAERAATSPDLPDRGWSNRSSSVEPSGEGSGPSTRDRRRPGYLERRRRARERARELEDKREDASRRSEAMDKLLP